MKALLQMKKAGNKQKQTICGEQNLSLRTVKTMKWTDVKSALIGKWFLSINVRGGINWWGQILDEVNPRAYLVRDSHGTQLIVLVDRMPGWQFFETREDLQKAINERLLKRGEGGVANDK